MSLFGSSQARNSLQEVKSRFDTLEVQHKHDMIALTNRVYSAEREIRQLRAINASLGDALAEFRSRMIALEDFKGKIEEERAPRRNNIADGRLTYEDYLSQDGPPLASPKSPVRMRSPNFLDGASDSHQEEQSAIDSLFSPNNHISPPTKSHDSDTDKWPVIPSKVVLAIDFGTDFSTVAYGAGLFGGRVEQVLERLSDDIVREIPTCVLYSRHGDILSWGVAAERALDVPGVIKSRWPMRSSVKSENPFAGDEALLVELPPGKTVDQFVQDFLTCLSNHAMEQTAGAVASHGWTDVVILVPPYWAANARIHIHGSATRSGLTNRSGVLKVAPNLKAAVAHCIHTTELQQLQVSQSFVICDAGNSSLNLMVCKVSGSIRRMKIEEVHAQTFKDDGAKNLDTRFRYMVMRLLGGHQTHTSPLSLAYLQHGFDETTRFSFKGEEDDQLMFHFTCFHTEDSHDPSVGLINGELAVPGSLLRREVYDPVINQMILSMEDTVGKSNGGIDALLLVGQFAQSDYLLKRVQQRFASEISIISRPPNPDSAACRGAARYGLSANLRERF